jgi:hypothetical protein
VSVRRPKIAHFRSFNEILGDIGNR